MAAVAAEKVDFSPARELQNRILLKQADKGEVYSPSSKWRMDDLLKYRLRYQG